MDAESLRRKESALATLLEQMDVPAMRRENLTPRNMAWLNRNMAANNKNHPMFQTARTLLTEILKENQKRA